MRLLFWDIESSPSIADVWGLWNNNVSLSQLRESSRVLCFAAKWQGEKKVQFHSEITDGHDGMVAKAHELLSEADVVCAYNGDSFDQPMMNAEFFKLGLPPPSPYKTIDLYLVVKKNFRFPSSKLEYLLKTLELPEKLKHEGHELWVKVMAGDIKAWKTMRQYNERDVIGLEGLYDKMLPWIKSHPSRILFDGETCTHCTSGDLVKEGYAYTSVGKFQRWHCKSCGAWSRSTKRLDGVKVQGIL